MGSRKKKAKSGSQARAGSRKGAAAMSGAAGDGERPAVTKAVDRLDALITADEEWEGASMEQLERVLGALDDLSREQERVAPVAFWQEPRAARMERFQAWLFERSGISLADQGISVREAEGQGFGVFAERDISHADAVCRVPHTAMVSLRTAQASPPFRALARKYPILRDSPTVSLALFTACSAWDDASPHGPYLRSLPDTYSIPLFLPAAEWRLLAASSCFVPSVQFLRSVVAHYVAFSRLAWRERAAFPIPPHAFTWPLFRWALGAVLTRQNEVPLAGDGGEGPRRTLALVPVFDLMNHEASGRVTTDFDDAVQALVVHAKRDFAPGEQVRIFYGERSSALLVQFSGFMPVGGTPLDAAELPTALPAVEEDPTARVRGMILRSLGIAPAGADARVAHARVTSHTSGDGRRASAGDVFVFPLGAPPGDPAVEREEVERSAASIAAPLPDSTDSSGDSADGAGVREDGGPPADDAEADARRARGIARARAMTRQRLLAFACVRAMGREDLSTALRTASTVDSATSLLPFLHACPRPCVLQAVGELEEEVERLDAHAAAQLAAADAAQPSDAAATATDSSAAIRRLVERERQCAHAAQAWLRGVRAAVEGGGAVGAS